MIQPHIGVLQEKSLHASVKTWYAGPEDQLETKVDGYVIDIVRADDLLVENDHTAYPWIRVGGVKPSVCQLERPRHITVIVLAEKRTHFDGS